MFDNLTKVASIVPILAAIYFTCRGFIGLGMTMELVGILTVLFASLSWLLSQAILRFLAVRHNGPMAASVVILGTAFLITEASLTHIGLEWLLGQGALEIPGWVTWFFSVALSLTNVMAKWAFLGDAGERSTATKPYLAAKDGRKLEVDPRDERTLEQIAAKVVATG
jgi:hypothetical protein